VPFWVVVFIATVVGLFLALHDRSKYDPLALIVPMVTASVVMAPYLIHGLGTFPGSWFWDGFAYMAAGESLWILPRHETAAGLELFYQFGHKFAQYRYISSSILSMMKGIFPLGGDAQAAMGYFLFLCLFTFSSSCYFLAKVAIPDRRHLQIVFVVVASVSGPLLNLVWANNFDHLLAMSIAPIIIALAFSLRWGDIGDAILLGLFVAAEVHIYLEMAVLFVMPACLILLVRLFREGWSGSQIKSGLVALAAVLILVVPVWPDLYAFFLKQIDEVAKAAIETARPGNGYFPTFFSTVCGPAAWFGMFHPFAQCDYNFAHYAKLAVSIGCWIVLGAALLSWRKNAALILAAVTIAVGAAFFLIVQNYDYAAFKILETGWVPLVLLVTLSAIDSGRAMKLATASVAAALVVISVVRVASFERWSRSNPSISFPKFKGPFRMRAA